MTSQKLNNRCHRSMRFCVVSWLLSFQVPFGILWACASYMAGTRTCWGKDEHVWAAWKNFKQFSKCSYSSNILKHDFPLHAEWGLKRGYHFSLEATKTTMSDIEWWLFWTPPFQSTANLSITCKPWEPRDQIFENHPPLEPPLQRRSDPSWWQG